MDEMPIAITVKTPLGDCEIPFDSEQVRAFFKTVMKDTQEPRTLYDEEACEFLELPIGQEEEEFEWWEEEKVPSLLYDLDSYLKEDFIIVKNHNYTRQKMEHSAIVSKHFEYPTGNFSFPIKTTYFIKSKIGNEKFVISMFPVDGINIDVRIAYDDTTSSVSTFIENFNTYHITKGILKNSKFNSDLKFLDYESTTWNDIILTDSQRASIKRNITKFIDNIDSFKEKGLPLSRGVLVTGPPGTGKTLLCNTIMSQMDCTLIYITSDSIKSRGEIVEMYNLARSLSPSIVVVEDIDTLGTTDRESGGDSPLLGEFLNCLAGVEKNDGVITIATTNYPKHLDKALIDRPGRFDIRLDLGLPDGELRKTILKRYLRDIKHDKIDFKSLINITDGMAGAHLKEIVMLSYMVALEDNEYKNDVTLSGKLILDRAKYVAEKRQQYNFHESSNSASAGMHY